LIGGGGMHLLYMTDKNFANSYIHSPKKGKGIERRKEKNRQNTNPLVNQWDGNEKEGF